MKHPPGTIVVGVDDSPSSRLALDWAVEQAALEGRALTLVHSVDVAHPAMSLGAAFYPPEGRVALADAGHALLAKARARIGRTSPDVVVHETFRLADPRHALLELSEEAHLVVVGSRGNGPLAGLLLGSVGVALVRHAHCPVVVHRPGKAGAVRHGIVVGVDGSAESAPVLEFAYREAALRDLPLTVLLSVWDIQTSAAGGYLISDVITTVESERLALSEVMAGKGEDYPDVKATTEVAHGLPFEMLVEFADTMNLLVVGSRRDHRLAHLLAGSVSAAVVEHATCPVAVVPVHDLPARDHHRHTPTTPPRSTS